METKKKKIGFILNPYAGIGGKAGLKGSDNYKKIEKLLLEGCERTASKRAESCMSKIADLTASLVAGDKGLVGEKNFSILSAPGDMGKLCLRNLKSHVMWCYVQRPIQAAQKIRSFVHKL